MDKPHSLQKRKSTDTKAHQKWSEPPKETQNKTTKKKEQRTTRNLAKEKQLSRGPTQKKS